MARLLSGHARTRLSMQALILLAAAVLVGGLAALVYVASLPYAGFEFVGQTEVGAILPDSPAEAAGLRAGDQVIEIDGMPRTPGAGYLRPGQTVLQLTVRRDGQTFPVDIPLRAPSLAERFYTGSHYLVALGLWAIAAAILFLKPGDFVSRLFVLMCLLGAMAIATWSVADLGLAWPNLLMSTLVVASGPVFLHFHTRFPEPTTLKGSRAVVVAAYLFGIALWLASTILDAAYYFQLVPASDDLPSLVPIIEAFFSLCVLGGLGLLVRTYLRTASEISRRRAALILLGTSLALVPFILLIALPQLLGIPYPVPTWLTLLLVLLIPLSYLYSILRHRLMDIDWIINRSVVFYLVSLILFALYLGLSVGLYQMAPRIFSGPLPQANLLLIPVLVFLFGPVKQGTQHLVDRAFYGGWYDYETLISRASERLRDALDVETISDLLVNEVAGTMRLKAAALLLRDQRHNLDVHRSLGFEQHSSICREGDLVASVQQVGSPVANETLGERLTRRGVAPDEWARWSEAGARVWVPLVQQESLLGLWVLGNKLAGDLFYPRDYRMLTTLAHQAAVALRRVSLMEDLRNQVHEAQALARQVLALQEKNQQQMAEEIHARVLQDLAVADLFLEDALSVHRPGEVQSAREVLREVSSYLRTVLFELQPPAWDTSDLTTILADYVSNVRERRRLPVEFRANGNGSGIDVPTRVRTALYRILQESLNNARKHAQASRVQVTLDVAPQRVHLEVRDDGVGFDMPRSLASYIDGNHLGLVGMREYAAQVSGRLHVESWPGLGTRIRLEIPLRSEV